jgi:hypothetical protein
MKIMRWWILSAALIIAIGCNWIGQADGSPLRPTDTVRAGTSPAQTAVRAGTSPAQTAIDPGVDPEQVLLWLCESHVYDDRNPLPGKIVRFTVPIAIHPNGSAAALTAIKHYEKATGGAVSFTIADDDPPVGITIIEGDAVGSKKGEPGCGNVTNGKAATSGHSFRTDPFGIFNSLTYVHLGSSGCDDEATGYKPESIAEHELAHALGVGKHFPDFTGDEGLSANLIAVVTKLYSLQPGTEMTEECAG